VVGDEEGVHIMMGPDGRETGEAFVELMSADDVKQALAKNKCHIGRRYIDGKSTVRCCAVIVIRSLLTYL